MTSHPPDYRLPLITSPMGAVPTSLYFSVLRGFDVLLLGTVPLLISPTPTGAAWSVGLMAARAVVPGRRGPDAQGAVTNRTQVAGQPLALGRGQHRQLGRPSARR